MAVAKNKTNAEDKEYWDYVEKVAEEVRHWPTWMGGDGQEPVCCPTCNRLLDKQQHSPK